MTLTANQFRILTHLFCGGCVEFRRGGYFTADVERVNYNTLRSLMNRGVLKVTVTTSQPSAGISSALVIDDRALTDLATKEFEDHLKTLWSSEREKIEKRAIILHERRSRR